MCTAATYLSGDFYFGRTLDHSFSFGDEVTVTPRNYPFSFRHMGDLSTHYAMIGMAHIRDGYPLYYDAVNEKGLGMAGLNFVGNAHYWDPAAGRDNVAQFELIPWILGQCADVEEARTLLARLQIVDTPFQKDLPPAQQHWLLADRKTCITVEPLKEGLVVYDNPVGVLTNNPPFDFHLLHLNHYMHLSAQPPVNQFAKDLPLGPYSLGMGALGLPGDLSSSSRFVRATFARFHAVSGSTEETRVGQFFHMLGTVEQAKGCNETAEGQWEYTQYTSCCNTDSGVYYYTTYENHQITAVDMHRQDLDDSRLFHWPLIRQEQFREQN